MAAAGRRRERSSSASISCRGMASKESREWEKVRASPDLPLQQLEQTSEPIRSIDKARTLSTEKNARPGRIKGSLSGKLLPGQSLERSVRGSGEPKTERALDMKESLHGAGPTEVTGTTRCRIDVKTAQESMGMGGRERCARRSKRAGVKGGRSRGRSNRGG